MTTIDKPRYWIEQRKGESYYVCSDMMKHGLGPFTKDDAEQTIDRLNPKEPTNEFGWVIDGIAR